MLRPASRWRFVFLLSVLIWPLATGVLAEGDPAAVMAALAAAAQKYTAMPQPLAESVRPDACAELRAGVKELARLSRAAESEGRRLALPPLPKELVVLLVSQCREDQPIVCDSALDTIAFDLNYLVEVGLIEPDAPNGDEIQKWFTGVARLCLNFTVDFETATSGQHVDYANCHQPIALDVNAEVRISPLEIERVDGRLYLTGTGAAPHTIARYTHSLSCAAGDSATPNSAVSSAPMEVRVRFDPYNVDPDVREVAPHFIVDIRPGKVNMTWTVCARGDCEQVSYEWWHQMFGAHYADRAGEDGYFRFVVLGPAASPKVAETVFNGHGSYDDVGVWTGEDHSTITLTATGSPPP